MLSETVQSWKKEGEIQGRQKGIEEGRQEGRQEGIEEGMQKGRQQEAAKLFLLLLDSKFGTVSLELQAKIRQASPEDIEKWTKQIFQAETPETLLNS
jgi:predicted transposase YdaD